MAMAIIRNSFLKLDFIYDYLHPNIFRLANLKSLFFQILPYHLPLAIIHPRAANPRDGKLLKRAQHTLFMEGFLTGDNGGYTRVNSFSLADTGAAAECIARQMVCKLW